MHSDTSFRGKTIAVFSKLLYHARLTSADASDSVAEDVVNDLIGACLEEKKTRDAFKSAMPTGKADDYPWTTQMIQAYKNYIDAATAHDHKRVDSLNSYIVNELKKMEDKTRDYAIGCVESPSSDDPVNKLGRKISGYAEAMNRKDMSSMRSIGEDILMDLTLIHERAEKAEKQLSDLQRTNAIGSVESTTYPQQPGYYEMSRDEAIRFRKMTYAHDELETDTPWERWEFRVPFGPKSNQWTACLEEPHWHGGTEYRRKVIRKVGKENPMPIAGRSVKVYVYVLKNDDKEIRETLVRTDLYESPTSRWTYMGSYEKVIVSPEKL